MEAPSIFRIDNLLIGKFSALGCGCEVLFDTRDEIAAQSIFNTILNEAFRIQKKFSRYETDNITWAINHANGNAIVVDDETEHLLNYANLCFDLSEGYFDITSGVLGKLWKFSTQNQLPLQQDIDKLLPFVGWQKVERKNHTVRMLPDMQIDFGGIGKEYAVDRCLQLAKAITDEPLLVNFGGDLAVSSAKKNNSPWLLGIESPNNAHAAVKTLEVFSGAIATSGDAKRSIQINQRRYSHILNPFTGWPIESAPRSITVASANCTQAGTLSTLAMLRGANAEEFLKAEGVEFWCLRED